jgi:nitrogen fixation protein
MAVKEEVFYEGGPHIGDLIIGIILLFFVITIPLSVGAIARALWVRYRISSRRISVTSGWMGRSHLDVVYAEIAKVVIIPRGFGAWGDMVLTLKDGSRLEMRSLPKFRQAYDYVEQRLSLKAKQVSGAIGASKA